MVDDPKQTTIEEVEKVITGLAKDVSKPSSL